MIVAEQGWMRAINPFRPLSGERALFREDILLLVNLIRERCNKVGQQLSVKRVVPSLRRMSLDTEGALSRSRETWWRIVGRQRLED